MAGTTLKTRHLEWLIGAGVAAVCVAASFFLLIRPVTQEIQSLHRGISQAKEKITLYNSVKEMKVTVRSLESSLAMVSDRSMLVNAVSDLATKSGITIQGITPRTEVIGEYAKMRMEIEMKCPYFSLIKFLKALQDTKVPLDIPDITLTQPGVLDMPQENRGKGLQGRMTVGTLLKQKAAKS
jgi:type II secretory pathway component PulM